MHADLSLSLRRFAPHRIPQRDFVVSYGEPLTLTIRLRTEDGPDGQPVSMLGIRPVLVMHVFGGQPVRDYGHVTHLAQQRVEAVVQSGGQSAVLTLPASCSVLGRFSYLLTYGGPFGAQTLLRGALEVLPGYGMPDYPGEALPDGAIVTDDGQPILVADGDDLSGGLLLESGFSLLTEAGDALLLESGAAELTGLLLDQGGEMLTEAGDQLAA